jgi:biotin-[acetyl-CoA-carboxylase] ligase BirA-like protein
MDNETLGWAQQVDWLKLGLRSHTHFPSIDSTNRWACETTGPWDAARLPLLVTCEEQTAGRGRHGRSWWQGNGGLAFSLVMDLPHSPPGGVAGAAGEGAGLLSPHWLSLWNAVVLQRTAASFLPDQVVRLKWPNDLIIDDRKNAGILTESVSGRPGRVVVGIGVNINNRLDCQTPTEAREGFSWAETHRLFDLGEVLRRFVVEWLRWDYQTPDARAQLLRDYRAVDGLRGKRLQVTATNVWEPDPTSPDRCIPMVACDWANNGTFQGDYAGLTPEGYLSLTGPAGELWVFPAAERVRAVG